MIQNREGEPVGTRIFYPYGDPKWSGLRDRPPSTPLVEHVYPALARLSPGAVVYDLGCGDGNFELNAPSPGERPYAFRCFDHSEEAVLTLRSALERLGGQDRAEKADITTLNLRGVNANAVILSRVAHALGPEDQIRVVGNAADGLKPGGSLYFTVLADIDWKPQEARKVDGYKEDTLYDFYRIMRLDKIERTASWWAYPFSQSRIAALAVGTGLELVGKIETFQEPTSFDHLREEHPFVTYYYAQLRKPTSL